jgi:hypothetical protein
MANWGSLWFRKMARHKQMVSKMARHKQMVSKMSGNPSETYRDLFFGQRLISFVHKDFCNRAQ